MLVIRERAKVGAQDCQILGSWHHRASERRVQLMEGTGSLHLRKHPGGLQESQLCSKNEEPNIDPAPPLPSPFRFPRSSQILPGRFYLWFERVQACFTASKNLLQARKLSFRMSAECWHATKSQHMLVPDQGPRPGLPDSWGSTLSSSPHSSNLLDYSGTMACYPFPKQYSGVAPDTHLTFVNLSVWTLGNEKRQE